MKKRVIGLICGLALLLTAGATTAFAQENPASVMAPQSSGYTFNLSINKSSIKYRSGVKNDNTAADVYVQGGSMQSGDNVGFGVYDSNKNPVYTSAHVTHSIPDTFSINYTNAKPGNYYLGATVGSMSYSNSCTVSGIWYP